MPAADPAALIEPVAARSRIIAVVTVSDHRHGAPLARALARGGVEAVEITLRTPAGLEAVRAAAAEVPEAMVGAGTCLTPADLEAAQRAGAAFAVSPGAVPAMLDAAADLALPYLAGVATSSELMTGLAHGYRMFKFFPAVPAGGLAYLKALAGPFPQVRFCPTGGITKETAPQFLALPTVPCLGGSWLAPSELLDAENWDGVERLAREAVQALG
jgi:2-dehydro-3-deoxyphosphogluconate aldolase / (4S)-4-hydroxy-2-oxoglutarate aldolase